MTFPVYSGRWGHNDDYDNSKTATGWRITHNQIGGEADKTASPALYHLLDHDSINYPEELPGYFEWLWDNSAQWNDAQNQVELTNLAEWVNVVEKNSPRGVFSVLK